MELVDQYSRGAGWDGGELGLGTFEARLAEAAGARGPAPAGVTYFDGPLGRAVRRDCPPLLGLPAHCAPVLYVARRRELGTYETTRRLLRGAGIGTYLIEGAEADDGVHEIVRLEALARQLAATSGSVAAFLRNAGEAVYSAAQSAAAFACDASAAAGGAPPPGAVVVRRAVRELLGRGRLGPELVRHLLWAALASGLPVQLHGGDPLDVEPFVHDAARLGTDLVLLPDPAGRHHAAAAGLAAVHPHVYADTGPDPLRALRVAPAGKLLFSSGARELPELYVVAARRFERAMDRLTSAWPAAGLCSAADAVRLRAALSAGTATRVYRLPAG